MELLLVILCFWLFFKCIGLAFKVAWGAAKLIASLLLIAAIPMLVCCLLFTGGMLLLVPLGLLCVAFGLLKALF